MNVSSCTSLYTGNDNIAKQKYIVYFKTQEFTFTTRQAEMSDKR